MNTALHTIDQLTLANAEGDARRRRAAELRTRGDRRPWSTRRSAGIAFTTLVVLLTVGTAAPAVADGHTDTYTGVDKLVPGLVDGWFDPGAQPGRPGYPIGRVR